MGRGSSGKTLSASERYIADNDGSSIDLGENGLKYNGDDSALSGDLRKSVNGWEDKRGKAKLEYAHAYNEDGSEAFPERRGGKTSVKVPTTDGDAHLFTHVHPREKGTLGGTFSVADLSVFAKRKMQTMRAIAKEGTYSITKNSNFDANGASTYFVEVDKRATIDHNDRDHIAYEKYKQGIISRSEYHEEHRKSFNRMLVDMHNGYAEGASKYGYTYTLERRRK